MRDFIINKFLTLKLEGEKTVLYVDNKAFTQCKYLLLQVPLERVNELDDVDSIDEVAEKLDQILEGDNILESIMGVEPEMEYWAHCSNLQAWYENEYDIRLLHSNLAFPLLKKLTEVGDPLAKKVFKEEILLRLESGYPSVIIFLITENYIDFIEREAFLLSILNENDAFSILEIEKTLKIKLIVEYEDFTCDQDANAFLFLERKVIGLQLVGLNVITVLRHILKLSYLRSLIIAGCNLNKLPWSIKNLKNLTYLDLGDNKLKSIPREIRNLTYIQEVYLGANLISDVCNIVEITKNLDFLRKIELRGNKIEIFPEKLDQIKRDCNFTLILD